ncbi:MAG: hypothetical protein H8E91_07930 [Planctomycetes bacterium]|nr:hypothetical protein [Planctomycetota bacterium]
MLSALETKIWAYIRRTVWLLSLCMVVALFIWPTVGLHAFWDVLIPIAPALVALFPGVWRNICPAATMSQFARHRNMSKRKKLSIKTHGWFVLTSVVLLLLIIPLRHTYFDLNGPATGVFLIVATLIAICFTFVFDGKSGWCASLCPVHQVEKLYGQKPAATVGNAHCSSCSKCVTGCPDSTPAPSPHLGGKTWPRRAAAFGLIGCFPGYVWGWFQVQDYATLSEGLSHIVPTYMIPIAGGGVTLALYALFISAVPMQKRKTIDRFFAAAAISCYYWYRIPWLFGFSKFDGNGMLIDLSETIPQAAIQILPYFTTAFWVWWLAIKRNGLRAWMPRPPDEKNSNSTINLTVSANP